VFQCYTGFAYKDIFAFHRGIVTESKGVKYLDGKREKNGKPYYLPFFSEAQRIAEKYDYNFQNRSNQKYNSYLKEIADLCEIDKNLTSHVGRKTFAQRMVDVGYSAETISKMMGHVSFDMTQKHYARISEKRIENEYWKIQAA
jgi:integrase